MRIGHTSIVVMVALVVGFSLPTVVEAGLFGTGQLATGDDSDFFSVDPTDGSYTLIGNTGEQGVTGLAFDPNTDTFYGAHDADRLYSIDATTGVATEIGLLGANFLAIGLAFDPIDNVLYINDWTNDALGTVNTSTGTVTQVGANGVDGIQGLGFDPVTSTLWGVSGVTDSLYTINTDTGAATLVGALGIDLDQFRAGLAWDVNSGRLFMTDSATDDLYVLNTTTGAATGFGDSGLADNFLRGGLTATYDVIPEPATAGLLGLAALALVRRRRAA